MPLKLSAWTASFLMCVVAFLRCVPAAGAQEVRLLSSGGASDSEVVGTTVTVEVKQRRGRAWASLPAGATVRWFRIRPRMQHTETEPPNEGVQQYSNSVLFGPNHGQWIGYDQVEYEQVPLVGDQNTLDLSGAGEDMDGPGTLWLSAEVTYADGHVAQTPAVASRDRLGLTNDVFRISFRTDDSLLGWLSTYFGVPNIFGSTAPQADRYVGADCADVLVGAMRAAGHRSFRYASVSGIRTFARPRSEALRMSQDRVTADSGNVVEVLWGQDVSPGDFLTIDYVRADSLLPRSWDHIGAMVGDTDGDGVLSGGDLLRHMTPRGLVDRPIGSEGEIRLRIYRARANF